MTAEHRDKKAFDLKLIAEKDFSELESVLRNVSLLGDKNAFPYSDAEISIKRQNIKELRPLAFYVLSEGLAFQRNLKSVFKNKYSKSTLNMHGMLDYELNGEMFSVCPPIVEKYYEPSEGKEIKVIVDGLHRIYLAFVQGFYTINTVEISKVPSEYPLVPMPLKWEDVKEEYIVPKVKRVYRFPDSPNPYFFYRDLSLLGSSGIRKLGTK